MRKVIDAWSNDKYLYATVEVTYKHLLLFTRKRNFTCFAKRHPHLSEMYCNIETGNYIEGVNDMVAAYRARRVMLAPSTISL